MKPELRLCVRAWVAAFVLILVLDGLWLGLVARDFYRAQMGALMADTIRVVPALMFYLGYPLGLVFLVLRAQARSFKEAALVGAVVGLIAYGSYDMTNLAVLRGWPVALSLVDWFWGTAVSACAGALAWRVARV